MHSLRTINLFVQKFWSFEVSVISQFKVLAGQLTSFLHSFIIDF